MDMFFIAGFETVTPCPVRDVLKRIDTRLISEHVHDTQILHIPDPWQRCWGSEMFRNLHDM